MDGLELNTGDSLRGREGREGEGVSVRHSSNI